MRIESTSANGWRVQCIATAAVCLFGLSACGKTPAPPEALTPTSAVSSATQAGQAASTPPSVLPDSPVIAGDSVSARYACEGNRVDIVRDGKVARIAMRDGRVVRLGLMQGSHPVTWRDVGLSFIQHKQRIVLEQDDGPTLVCQVLDR